MLEMSIVDRVAVVTLSRPPVNAISDAWVRLFDERLDELSTRTDWNVLHIRSDMKVFCAGADLNEVRGHIASQDGPDRMYAYVAGIQRLFARIEHLAQATVAEIGGAAIGGGLELALACDLRIAATTANLGLPEARLGLVPGAGGTQRLTRLCGRSVAARLILSAEIIDGTNARELGIVQWAVPATGLQSLAAELARHVATLPPAAVAAGKACIATAGPAGRGGYSDELEATRQLLSEAETRERIEGFLDVANGDPAMPSRGAIS